MSELRMSSSNKILSAWLIVACLLGCQHPENDRWSSAEFLTGPEVVSAIDEAGRATGVDWNQPQVIVYGYPTPPKDPTPSLTIKDFSDHGQEALIDRLTQKGAKPDEIRAALAKPITSGSASAGDPSVTPKRELYRFDRNLVATVTKGLAAKPGERLMWTWILIRPVNFEFTGYTVVATDNQSLNVEHIQHQTTTQVQGQVSGTIPGPGTVSPSLSGGVTNQYTTSADIAQQYEKLGVDILPRFLRIYRESERNLDVAGNTLISISALSDPSFVVNPKISPTTRIIRATNLKVTKGGTALSPKDASLDVELLKSPLHCPLRAQVRLVYQIRRINSHDKNYVEGEQDVSIEQHASEWRYVDVVSADDVVPASFGIFDPNRIGIYLTTPNGERLPLAFADYESAGAMANWMNTQHASVIGKTSLQLTLGGSPMSKPYPLLHAERIGDERPPQEQRQICDALVLSDSAGHF
jgi:hypothetical protein